MPGPGTTPRTQQLGRSEHRLHTFLDRHAARSRVKSPLTPTRPIDLNQPDQIVRINAGTIADAVSGVVPHAALVVRLSTEGLSIVFAGPAAECPQPIRPYSRTIDLPDRLVMPGLVNAHTHLDLSHIGPIPHEPGEGFVKWVDQIRASRHQRDDAIAESVRLGVELSRAGGTVAVGDIAGAPAGRLTDAPARALAGSGLAGVSYLEFFGIGRSSASAVERLAAFAQDRLPGIKAALAGTGLRFGLQPHAPNTVDLGVYRWAAELARTHDLPLSTHLAETPEERAFIADATGPQRAMLERLGVWDDSILDHAGQGKHPVAHLHPILERQPVLCAHVNDAPDRAIELLAGTGTPVAYCPRASAYFGAAEHFGPHRYRDMLDAGIPVCLGTDSIVNLDTPDRISVLDEMRLLHRRDGTDARTLLAMATVNGADALGLDPASVTLGTGPVLGLVAVPIAPGSGDPWADAMGGKSAPEDPILSRESF